MSVDSTNVLVGSATIWIAAADEPMPADSVDLGADWAGNWLSPGATDQGVDLTVGRDIQKHMIDEQSTPALITVNTSNIQVDTSFAEDVLTNLKTAYGGGTITTTAAGTGQVGKSTLTLAESLDTLAVGLEGKNKAGFWRRIYIPRVISAAEVKTTFRRSADYRKYPVSLQAICPLDDILIVDMTAVATG